MCYVPKLSLPVGAVNQPDTLFYGSRIEIGLGFIFSPSITSWRLQLSVDRGNLPTVNPFAKHTQNGVRVLRFTALKTFNYSILGSSSRS